MHLTRPCIFCQIVKKELPAAEILRTGEIVTILDKYPINIGHSLVIPTRHYNNLLQMPATVVGELYALVPLIAGAVVSTVKADGFNVGQNNGLAANQIVPHVHVHIVPRFQDDSADGRWPSRRVADHDELTELAAKIRDRMSAGKKSGKRDLLSPEGSN